MSENLPQNPNQQQGQNQQQPQYRYAQQAGQDPNNQQYGQPQQGVPTQPAAPNPIVLSLKDAWQGFLDIFKSSNPVGAHERIAQSQWGWMVVTGAQSIVSAIFITQLVSMVSFSIASLLSPTRMYSRSYWANSGLNFGQIILVFVTMLAVVFGVQVLRGVSVMLTARIGKLNVTFRDAMNSVAAAALALVPTYTAIIILIAIIGILDNAPDVGTFFIIVLTAAFAFAIIIGETLMYLYLNRLGSFNKSPIVIHATMSSAWVLSAILAYYITGRMLTNMLIG